MNPLPWMPGFKIGDACVMPLLAYYSMATNSNERAAALDIARVEEQVKAMMKEAVEHARARN